MKSLKLEMQGSWEAAFAVSMSNQRFWKYTELGYAEMIKKLHSVTYSLSNSLKDRHGSVVQILDRM